MKAIDVFQANIARARELGQLYNALSAITTPALSAEDLLRSHRDALSATDFLERLVEAIHEEIKYPADAESG